MVRHRRPAFPDASATVQPPPSTRHDSTPPGSASPDHAPPASAGRQDSERLPAAQAEPVAVITMSAAGVVEEFNPQAEALTGYSRAEAVGARLVDLVIPDRLGGAHEAGLRRFRDRGEAPLLDHRIEVPLRRRDGTETLAELVITRAGESSFTGLLRPVARPGAVPAELHLSANFYRALIDYAPILITVVDSDGQERWTSPGRTAVLGPGPDAKTLTHLDEQVHPADRELARTALRRAMSDGLDEPVELRVQANDGSWRALSVLAASLVDNPAVHGTVLYGQDITRARAAEQQARVEAARMNILIESLGVGVLLQDEQGRVVLSNSAFVEMFALGLGPDRLRGTPLRADSGGYADRDAAVNRTDETMRRGRPALNQEFSLTDGRVVERDYMPITMDGATHGHLWVFRDVTAQADIRRGLEERNRILTELSALKTEFVAVLSHELRTPLTSITTFASMADDPALGAEDRHNAMEAIRRNAARMFVLVADLVLLAKLESGEIVLGADTVDLADLVRQSCAELPAEHLETSIGTGPPVAGDAGLLRQAVATAVGVVASAGDSGTRLIVDAHAGAEGWTLAVRTPTAEPASSERLLSTRLPHPEAPGEWRTGALALMLSREIAVRHHGTLVTNVDGCDITVTLRVPARR